MLAEIRNLLVFVIFSVVNNLYTEQSLLIHSIFNNDRGISSKCHMIGFKSRALF